MNRRKFLRALGLAPLAAPTVVAAATAKTPESGLTSRALAPTSSWPSARGAVGLDEAFVNKPVTIKRRFN